MNIYENLNDEAKEIYAYVIEKYLGLSFYSSEIMKEKITPEVAKKVDEFLKAMHDCTKQINFFTNIFKKSNTIIGLIKAIGKEKAKEELTTAFNKTIKNRRYSIVCYSVLKRTYANEITPMIL
jgi:hypothetical protein